ncbi:MAG: glycoside hydrolase family 127 protein [Bacteroidales bacterium]|nr:glycoside hydrolase family 127 protein [Bacteroidales bacterium]
MRPFFRILTAGFVFALAVSCSGGKSPQGAIRTLPLKDVCLDGGFWGPRMQQWATTTANDVLDKFERDGIYTNFDSVAEGLRDIGKHAGPPWYDGLTYETIRGISDLLVLYPDPVLESRLDTVITHIIAAQASEPTGYINTYTQLNCNDKRWGKNGGQLRWQHDVYNSGCLVEAGIHFYRTTGKTDLLEAATKLANYMYDIMGPAPKWNVVPGHAQPEEALVKLYRLFKDEPGLAARLSVPVKAVHYKELAEFWIEQRGHYGGEDPQGRPSEMTYAQDSIPIFEQQTIEGHAVRATLLMTGLAAAAIENHDRRYIDAAKRLWDNMAGQKWFITGGVGAVHFDEKFGPDKFLPTDAYLETCAAVGAGFFSQRMNELTGKAFYMDEYERALYNNVLTGISFSGDRYTYQNPLNAEHHARWEWHGCPCCPPMFLKYMGAMPGYIYGSGKNSLYVNLFVSSHATVDVGGREVKASIETDYPWNGKIKVTVSPGKAKTFDVKIRIPGWASGKENPYDLYTSQASGEPVLFVCGDRVPIEIEDGYAVVRRKWSDGDEIELNLPMNPRLVTAHPDVTQLKGRTALACGPIVYCLETIDNEDFDGILDPDVKLELKWRGYLLGGIGTITGYNDGNVVFTAIPYYAVGNRIPGAGYTTWSQTGE